MCPICQSGSERKRLCGATLGGGSLFDLVECPDCAVRYLSPDATPAQLEHFYRPQYYGTDWYKQQGWGAAFARVVLKDYEPGRFLDVGCGLGYFIDGIRRQTPAWEVSGVELTSHAVEYARRELRLDVRQGLLSEANFPSAHFDYIQIRNVLEHVTDPMSLLRECRRILKGTGTLHLFVPNGVTDSLNLIKFERETGRPGLSRSGHLFFFPRRALLRAFEATGFRVERARTYGIRRGLAVLGLWPHFKDWKRDYVAREDDNHSDAASDARDGATSDEPRIKLPPKKERPDLYYTYRQVRMNLRMLPGLREFGLDYELLLRPV